MKYENIIDKIKALPPDAQSQIVDFINFLEKQYMEPGDKQSDLSDEPFVGIWRDREDMNDSSTWVRTIRCSEWVLKNG